MSKRKLENLHALRNNVPDGWISPTNLENLAGNCTSMSVVVSLASLYTCHVYDKITQYQRTPHRLQELSSQPAARYAPSWNYGTVGTVGTVRSSGTNERGNMIPCRIPRPIHLGNNVYFFYSFGRRRPETLWLNGGIPSGSGFSRRVGAIPHQREATIFVVQSVYAYLEAPTRTSYDEASF